MPSAYQAPRASRVVSARIFATYGERRVELRLCHRIGPDYSGPVWRVLIDGEGGPERFVDLDEAKQAAEERVGVALAWTTPAGPAAP